MTEVQVEKFDLTVHGLLIDELTLLLHSAYADLAQKGMHYWASYQSSEETLQRLTNGESFLAFYDSQLAGTINLRGPKPENRAVWYRRNGVYSFHQFAIAPKLQGQGIGSVLLSKAESRVKELGGTEIALDTAEQATQLISMYEKRGYRFIEYVQWDRVNYRSVIMSKSLVQQMDSPNVSADAYRAKVYRGMSPARKWEEWKRLQNMAWALKMAGVKATHPSWSEQEVKKAVKEIFLYAVT